MAATLLPALLPAEKAMKRLAIAPG
jgi:hypothetical protein